MQAAGRSECVERCKSMEIRQLYCATIFFKFFRLSLFFLFFWLILGARCFAIDFGDSEVAQYFPYLEWEVANSTSAENDFDIVAEVTFTHTTDNTSFTTEMFFAGGDIWKFRFTGILPGTWRFTTTSSDPDLDGHTGRINVSENTQPDAAGFITRFGEDPKKWARQTGLMASPAPFIPQYVMYDESYDISPADFEGDIERLLDEHGFTGLHIPVKEPDLWTTGGNPNLSFFADLEELLVRVHKAGYASHLWVWGDESRGQYPKWGINGVVDKRLQRYICARLGPIPGWSAGYGFDLWEWVNETQLDEWHDYMQAHLGWSHPLGARSNKNQFNQISEKMDYSSYELHKESTPNSWYEQWVRVVDERQEKPGFSEDRFRIRGKYPDKDVTEEETRRGLYYAVLAGGAAGIWGNMKYPDDTWKSSGKSLDYPNKEQIITWSVFWNEKRRFIGDMVRANHLSDGYVLHSPSSQSYVVYKEDASTVSLYLEVNSTVPVVAVDTKNAYREIDMGDYASGDHTFVLPSNSDWVIAAGGFEPLPQPELAINRTEIYFGDIATGEQREESIILSNTGAANLVIGQIAESDPVALPFSIVGDNCSGRSFSPAESCTITIRFEPMGAGEFSDTFDIPTNGTPSTTTVVLRSGDFPWFMFLPALRGH